jgi:hypothetical protein
VKANGESLSGIPLSVFPDDVFVVAGDVHEPQTLGVVTYVGSPCLCSFGDSYQPRVLLLDGLDVKSIKVQGQQKRLIDIVWPAEPMMDYFKANDGDIVKIRAHIKMEHVAQWSEIRQEIEQWAVENKFIINTIVPEVEYVHGERAKVVKGDKKSDNQYLTAYVKRSGADAATAKVGQGIIKGEDRA